MVIGSGVCVCVCVCVCFVVVVVEILEMYFEYRGGFFGRGGWKGRIVRLPSPTEVSSSQASFAKGQKVTALTAPSRKRERERERERSNSNNIGY